MEAIIMITRYIAGNHWGGGGEAELRKEVERDRLMEVRSLFRGGSKLIVILMRTRNPAGFIMQAGIVE